MNELDAPYTADEGIARALSARQPFDRNLFLIGFMGVGKSTIADALSALWGMEVLEMDSEIQRRAGMSISDIFSAFGEEAFRQMETGLITSLEPDRHFVVSCGGGTVLRDANVNAMRSSGAIVWLTATPETVLSRVSGSSGRPLLEGHKDIAYIEAMMNQRQPKYAAAADISIATDGKSAAEICSEIMTALRHNGSAAAQGGKA